MIAVHEDIQRDYFNLVSQFPQLYPGLTLEQLALKLKNSEVPILSFQMSEVIN